MDSTLPIGMLIRVREFHDWELQDVPMPKYQYSFSSVLTSVDQETLDAFDILFLPPRTCLSCGAKTNTAGELPCGH